VKLSITTTHTITFDIKAFEQTEGGMNVEVFRSDIGTLDEALHALEVARSSSRDTEWLIVANVTTQVGR
jgi:hypothetical protein